MKVIGTKVSKEVYDRIESLGFSKSEFLKMLIFDYFKQQDQDSKPGISVVNQVDKSEVNRLENGFYGDCYNCKYQELCRLINKNLKRG